MTLIGILAKTPTRTLAMTLDRILAMTLAMTLDRILAMTLIGILAKTPTRTLARTLYRILAMTLYGILSNTLTWILAMTLTGILAENPEPQDTKDNQMEETDCTIKKTEKDDKKEMLQKEFKVGTSKGNTFKGFHVLRTLLPFFAEF